MEFDAPYNKPAVERRVIPRVINNFLSIINIFFFKMMIKYILSDDVIVYLFYNLFL